MNSVLWLARRADVRSSARRDAARIVLALCLAACGERVEPPGAENVAGPRTREVGSLVQGASMAAAADAVTGTIADNLPFMTTSDGLEKLASIAWRTWIYTDTGPARTRYGYLRAGSVVPARGPKLVNAGCEGGWLRINPRGFVCLGLGATLDLAHPVVVATQVRPVRRAGLPYHYAMADGVPPLLYFRLPSAEQMSESEGGDITVRAESFRERARHAGLLEDLGEIGAPPAFLQGGAKLEKPYGVEQPLRYQTHAGPAAADSGFALLQAFEWEKRLFGLSSELDLIALDRTKLVRESKFRGIELAESESLPAGFAKSYAERYALLESGAFVPRAALAPREGVKLTGQRKREFLETQEGSWVLAAALRQLMPRESFPSFATGERKWLDISIKQQSLVAYVGKKPVYATLISSGRGGLGDPEETQATPRGTFMIYQKELTSTMDGDEDEGDSYSLRDVPFVQYFHKGFALHGTYWHDEFGQLRSHGCVNLSPIDAAWLFEWTDPSLPPDWHGVINKDRGTVVYIHP